MMILLIVIHVIACIGLILLVMIQRGRGGGLVESFSGVESMFGTKTSAFLTRATTVLSIAFFITCLSLAVLSVRQSKSLMRNVQPQNVPLSAQSSTATQTLDQAAQQAERAEEQAAAEAPVAQEKPQETPKTE